MCQLLQGVAIDVSSSILRLMIVSSVSYKHLNKYISLGGLKPKIPITIFRITFTIP